MKILYDSKLETLEQLQELRFRVAGQNCNRETLEQLQELRCRV
jgi:hypothetical protein